MREVLHFLIELPDARTDVFVPDCTTGLCVVSVDPSAVFKKKQHARVAAKLAVYVGTSEASAKSQKSPRAV